MLRTGCALMLVGLWSLPLRAEDPAVEFDLQVEAELTVDVEPAIDVDSGVVFDQTLEFTSDNDASVELVDPMPEELIFMSFSSEVVEDDVCPEGHAEHECIEFVDGQCVETDCIWMRTRTLDADVVADGEELYLFTLSGAAENDLSIQTFGGPLLPAATVEHAQGVAFDASLVGRAATVQPVVGLGLETAAAATAQTRTGAQGRVDAALIGSSELFTVSDADRDYASRLATIDAIRDQALVSGDVSLLQQADRMEAELKAHARAGFRLFGN